MGKGSHLRWEKRNGQLQAEAAEKEWLIQAIINAQDPVDGTCREYCIQWVGHTKTTWEGRDHLVECGLEDELNKYDEVFDEACEHYKECERLAAIEPPLLRLCREGCSHGRNMKEALALAGGNYSQVPSFVKCGNPACVSNWRGHAMCAAPMRPCCGQQACREAIHQLDLLEASGGVTLETVRAIAETGVDRISIGALTHSAPAVDLAIEWEA